VLLASLTGTVTSFVAHHGVYAIFPLLLIAAMLPIGSELVMLYAGAVASGSLGANASLFGHDLAPLTAYVAFVLAGTAGNVVGAALGWRLGSWGGRPFVERNGRWLHVSPAKLDRAERWLERYEVVAVPVGFAAPVLRSFVALPAGIVRLPFGRFLAGAAVGSAVFCSALAGVGWAVGSSYDRFHGNLRYVDAAVVVLAVAAVAWLFLRRRRLTRLALRGDDPAH
jgi:membrane protein DedA with SNARE-associated domain